MQNLRMYKERSALDDVVTTEINTKMVRMKYLSAFDNGIFMDAIKDGASISETTTILGFSQPTVSWVIS